MMELILSKPLLAIFMFLIVGFVFGYLSRQATISSLRLRISALNALETESQQPAVKPLQKQIFIDVHYKGTRIVEWYYNGVMADNGTVITPFQISLYFSKWYCAWFNTECIDPHLQPLVRRIEDAVHARVNATYENYNVIVIVQIHEQQAHQLDGIG